MAHSHSRTLLAKMGFGDPDLKNTRHDLACNYIGLNKEVLTATLQAAMPPGVSVDNPKGDIEFIVTKGDGKYSTTVGFVDVLANYTLTFAFKLRDPVEPCVHVPIRSFIEARQKEHPVLSKWVGRVDEMPEAVKRLYDDWSTPLTSAAFAATEPQREEESRLFQERVAAAPRQMASISIPARSVIEVKIQRESAGNLIRQLRLYNEHVERAVLTKDVRTPAVWHASDIAPLGRRSTEYGYLSKRLQGAFDRLVEIPRATIAVLDYDIDDAYAEALASAHITPVRLGAGFQRFVESNNSPSATPKKLTEI